MWMEQSLRLLQLEEGIFQELALEKRRLMATGRDVIDLGVGSPDLSPPQAVMDTLSAYVQRPDAYGYAITGLKAFDEAVAYFYRRYDVELDVDSEVLQLMGSQDGLAHLALALINPGDIILLPDPGYPIYEASIRLAGGVPYPLPIDEQTLHPAFHLVPDKVLNEARLMILNYPSNPTAGVATKEMFEDVLQIARRHDIFVIQDFAYSELIFDNHPIVSLLSLPGAKDVAIEFNSLSKTFNMAGCRIGYVVGNRQVIAHLRKIKSHIDYGVFLPIQEAAIRALTMDWTGLEPQRETYTHRRDRFCDALKRYGWDVRIPPATMFIWTPTPNGESSYAFAMDLLQKSGVAVTPGAAFGPRGEGHVRMAIVHDVDKLKEAADRVGAYLGRG